MDRSYCCKDIAILHAFPEKSTNVKLNMGELVFTEITNSASFAKPDTQKVNHRNMSTI